MKDACVPTGCQCSCHRFPGVSHVGSQRDSFSTKVAALSERIALAIVTHCQTHHTVLGEATADGPVCAACADAARIARGTT